MIHLCQLLVIFICSHINRRKKLRFLLCLLRKFTAHLLCGTLCKYKAFEKGITCQTISSVNTITCRLANCIQPVHGRLAHIVNPHTSHKVVLCRNHRNTFLSHIIPHLPAMLNDIWEMRAKFFLRNRPQIFPHMLRVILFHLFIDCFCEQVSRKKFVNKAIHILIIQLCSFSSYRFRNQETAFLLIP